MRDITVKYAGFDEKRRELVSMFGEATGLVEGLGLDKMSEKLADAGKKIEGDVFRVQVVGTFKNGKSTFINSFLGEDVLPAYALPCTAVINEVKYGPEKKARLHFKNPLPEKLPEELSAKALSHMKRYGMKNIPPMDIEYDEIQDFVVIPLGKDPKDMLLESPYEKVEIWWPLELLRHGIEIVDSPGLNEHATRTKVTMDYLARADAILFVLNATSLCSLEEMNFIRRNLKEYGFDNPFFVVNRFDLIPEAEKARIAEFAVSKLSEFTGFGEKGVFFVSARDALKAKIADNEELFRNSGMQNFEVVLSDYLIGNKGKIKLVRPAKELLRIVRDEFVEKAVSRQSRMLDMSLSDAEAKYDVVRHKSDILFMRKKQLTDKAVLKIEQTKAGFRRMAEKNQLELASAIPKMIDVYMPRAKMGLFPTRAKLKAVITEISSYVSENIEMIESEWRTNVLMPAVRKQIKGVFDYVETETKSIKNEISVIGSVMESSMNAVDSAAEHIGNGKLTFGYSSIYGTRTAGKQLAKLVVFEYTGTALIAALNIINPVAALGMVAAIAVGMQFSNESVALGKVKEMLSKEIAEKITASAKTTAEKLADDIVKNFADTAQTITGPIDDEIAELKSQTELVIDEIRKGRKNIDFKKLALDKTKKDAEDLCGRLKAFVTGL